MHPEPNNDTSNTALPQHSPLNSPITIQYGIQQTAAADAPHRHRGSFSGSASGSYANELIGNIGCDVGAKNTDGNDTREKRDRVSEYEAMGSHRLLNRDAGFRVKRTDWGGRTDSPVSRFPNEILVHILSFLDPPCLIKATLISRRFHSLITSPHAWRSAFARYFPPSVAPASDDGSIALSSQSDRRSFTRLSTTGANGNAWRKEYTLRTLLLRSLARGKAYAPGSLASCQRYQVAGSTIITYSANTGPVGVSHLSARFSSTGVRLVHASLTTEVVCLSEASTGKTVHIPLQMDPESPPAAFTGLEIYDDMDSFGVMDISEELGWLRSENFPDGGCNFYSYSAFTSSCLPEFFPPPPTTGLEDEYGLKPIITAAWIAKKKVGGIVETSERKVAMAVGNSRGVVFVHGISFGGNKTASNTVSGGRKYKISPGVPILGIKVDEDYSVRRMRDRGIWIVVVNALGEVYYCRHPIDSEPDKGFSIIPQTKRTPGLTYSVVFPPLDESLTEANKLKIEDERTTRLMKMEYLDLKRLWEGWGMDWFAEVDWADMNVLLGRKKPPRSEDDKGFFGFRRFHLAQKEKLGVRPAHFIQETPNGSETEQENSLFGGGPVNPVDLLPDNQFSSQEDLEENDIPVDQDYEQQWDDWKETLFSFGDQPATGITATALDMSTLATLSAAEDPALPGDIPGGNARLVAVGTDSGSIFVWNIRCPTSPTSTENECEPVNTHLPICTIHTESPQITTLALSSLYLVHGGNDGLVQAWDPLASTLSPIRTLHSRLSSRDRRSFAPVVSGINGVSDSRCISRCAILDPNPTLLRGVVTIGNYIRYWSFAGETGPCGKKRKKKPASKSKKIDTSSSSRGNGEFSGVIQSDILAHKCEMERTRREKEELESRYGVTSGKAALSEAEMFEYARMISKETFELESGGSAASGEEGKNKSTGTTVTPEGSEHGGSDTHGSKDGTPTLTEVDLDLAKALRLSLQETSGKIDNHNQNYWDEDTHAFPYAGPSTRYSPPPTFYSHKSITTTPSSKQWEKETASEEEWPGLPQDKGKRTLKGKEKIQFEDEFENDLEMAINLSMMEEEERQNIMQALEAGGKGK